MSARNLLIQSSAGAGAAAINAGLEPLPSLLLALVGVALARVAFTTKQQRLGERISITETLTITGMAMLVVGPIVWEHQLGLTTSAFLGLGAGWSSIALFDAIGSRVVNIISAIIPPMGSSTPPPAAPPSDEPRPDPRPPLPTQPPVPGQMVDLLEDIDLAEARTAAATDPVAAATP